MAQLNTSYIKSITTKENIESTSKLISDLKYERENCKFHYEKITFDKIKLWHKDENGNLRHDSGKFFSIEGLKTLENDCNQVYYQPIINQPEHGILGLILREIDGIIYCLVQHKIEPGNIGKVQISPSVQATKSNYTKVHNGKSVPYIEYFFDHPSVHVVYSQLQSEQGSKFYGKRNHNMIVHLKTEENIQVYEGYKWITFRQITQLLNFSNIINMDLRSILSALNFCDEPLSRDLFGNLIEELKLKNSINTEMLFSAVNEDRAVHKLSEIKQWLQEKKGSNSLVSELVNLNEVLDNGWIHNDRRIFSNSNPNFEVNYLEIYANNREVSAWSQPIVSDNNPKINGFLVKEINGVLHFLAKSCEEVGSFAGPELGPTIHNFTPSFDNDSFSAYFINPGKGKVLYDQMLSEEGGRFFQTENRYMIVLINEDIEITDSYKWLTLYQLKKLLEYECIINVEARTIISCVNYGEQL